MFIESMHGAWSKFQKPEGAIFEGNCRAELFGGAKGDYL